jgi:hypothetical protein
MRSAFARAELGCVDIAHECARAPESSPLSASTLLIQGLRESRRRARRSSTFRWRDTLAGPSGVCAGEALPYGHGAEHRNKT